MRLIIEPNYEQLSKWAANYVIERINAAKGQEKPFVLGLPTGSSPERMYAELIRLTRKEGLVSRTLLLSTWMSTWDFQRIIRRVITPSWQRNSSIILTVRKKISTF